MKSPGCLEVGCKVGMVGDEVSQGQTAEAWVSLHCSVVEDGVSQTAEKGAARWAAGWGVNAFL